ncbi:MAG TPA: helix-turn-helix domain-containing protein [Euzebyales bacterium]|nr:helix-turn-helix domain-containing protein [Euzebyales bacterium]
MSVEQRAGRHRALGDVHRLAIIDALWTGDRTAAQLQEQTGLASNLLAFHLNVLEQAGLVSRHPSQGDRRRRYVTLTPAAIPHVGPVARLAVVCVLFVCTHNAARSQIAAALWRARTGGAAASAGTRPAARVHPLAVTVAADHGLDLSRARPTDLADIDVAPDLVVSVCDRANEAGSGLDVPHRHWSIPDPDGGDLRTFTATFDAIAARIDRLAAEVMA